MPNLPILTRLASLALLATLAAPPGQAASPSLVDRIRVWVDDARTQRVEVDRVDPDDIADPSSFGLGAGVGVGQVSISFGWGQKKGIEYSERLEKVLGELKALCGEFNRGELSLESYNRRLREILAALDHARVLAMELAVRTSLEANEAAERLNEATGIDPRETAPHKEAILAALAEFQGHVEAVDQPLDPGAPRSAAELLVVLDEAEARRAGEEAVEEHLAAMDRPRAAAPTGEHELVLIWKDRARTERIAVPRLDVEGLVDDLEVSLGLQMKYSAPLITQYVGPRATWMLEQKARYDQAAQMLIVKYRRLCLEYNSGILCQEDWVQRLQELIEAERRAFDAREQLITTLNERKDEMRQELDRSLGGRELPDWARGAKERAEAKRQGIPRKGEERESVVEDMARGHLEDMAAQDSFAAAVEGLRVDLGEHPIRVRVNDREERTVVVPRLDTDLIAQNYETRLGLHISMFNFGPEATWTRSRGLEYGELAQELILKSKQLCADFNAGLVSMESYEHRTREIDASVDAAARVRESIVGLAQAMKKDARANLEHLREQMRDR